jgi:hypothetical protein
MGGEGCFARTDDGRPDPVVRDGVLTNDTRGFIDAGGPIDPTEDPFPAVLARVLLESVETFPGAEKVSFGLRSLPAVSEVIDGGRSGPIGVAVTEPS